MDRISWAHEKHPNLVRLAIVVLSIVAIVGLRKVEFDGDPRVMFRSENASYLRLLEFYKNTGEDDQDCIFLIEGQSLATIKGLTALQSFVLALNEDAGIDSVVSIFSARKPSRPFPFMLISLTDLNEDQFQQLRASIAEHPLIKGQLLSEDGHATAVVARLKGTQLTRDLLGNELDRLQNRADEFLKPHDLRCDLVGHPSVRVSVLNSLETEVMRFTLLGAAAAGTIAIFVFRSFTALLITLSGPCLGILWTLGAMGLMGVKIDPLLVILPTLLFVVGFTDAFHLLREVKANLAMGLSHPSAVRAAVRHIAPACAVTALTTTIGFGSLAVAGTTCIQRFGAMCAAGTVITFVAIQLLVPTILSSPWFQSRIKRSTTSSFDFSQLLRPAFRWMIYHHRTTAIVSLLLIAFCFVSSLQLRSDLKWLETLPRNKAVVGATERCDKYFGGTFLAYVVVQWPEGTSFKSTEVMNLLADVQRVCDEEFTNAKSFSIYNVLESIRLPDESIEDQIRHLHRMPKAHIERMVNLKRREAIVAIRVPDVGARVLEPKFDQLREKLLKLSQQHVGSRFELTGTIVVAAENVYQIIRDLSWSLSLASLAIFLVMWIVFRSIRIGLITVLPNILPQTLTAFVLVVAGESLTITTVLTFSLCLGLSVDDTVHFLMRYREERHGTSDDRTALLNTFASAGNAMLATSLVLIGGFAAMYASAMPSIRWFSILSCTTLVGALAADLVLLPVLLLCFPPRRESVHRVQPVAEG